MSKHDATVLKAHSDAAHDARQLGQHHGDGQTLLQLAQMALDHNPDKEYAKAYAAAVLTAF